MVCMQKSKYSMKEKLDIAESIVTILMFLMAVWGSIVSFEHGFWHKLYHVVDHYHRTIDKEAQKPGFKEVRKIIKDVSKL